MLTPPAPPPIFFRALHLAVIHEHEAFLDSILQHTEGTAYLDLQNDLGQVTGLGGAPLMKGGLNKNKKSQKKPKLFIYGTPRPLCTSLSSWGFWPLCASGGRGAGGHL